MDTSIINVNEFGTKFRSKNELYRFLVTDARMYLPPQKECSIYFVRDIFSGKKKVTLLLTLKALGSLQRPD